MKLLYCYIHFLDEKGTQTTYHGLKYIDLNLSATDKYTYHATLTEEKLQREERKAPLPNEFWTYDNTELEYKNIYNINIIAGENGSGKTTVIRCLMHILEFFYITFCKDQEKNSWNKSFDVMNSRALLLFEDDGIQYLLSHIPPSIKRDKPLLWEGFDNNQPNVLRSYGWGTFEKQDKKRAKIISDLLLKTKLIYMTNTLNLYDYERCVAKQNERQRDCFIYDVSIGAAMGCNANASAFFLTEFYKQVKYIFDKEQIKKREKIKEVRMPRALRLRVRWDLYNNRLGRTSLFTTTEEVRLSDLPMKEILGVLCVCAYADNLEKRLNDLNDEVIPVVGYRLLSNIERIPITKKNLIEELLYVEQKYCEHFADKRLWKQKKAIKSLIILANGKIVFESDSYELEILNINAGIKDYKLTGHNEDISCMVAFSDEIMVSGSFDGTIRIWDIVTRQCLHVMRVFNETEDPGFFSRVCCVTILSNGRVISASDDNILQVWDISTGKLLRMLRGHNAHITGLITTTDDKFISYADDGTLCVWDSSTYKCIKKIKGHKKKITCVVALCAGVVVSGAKDHDLRIWNTVTGQCVHVLRGHTRGITCMTILPDGRLVSGSDDKTLRIWDTTTGECLQQLVGHEKPVSCVVVLPDDRIASGSYDGTIRIWDTFTGKCDEIKKRDLGYIKCITVLPNGQICSALSTGEIYIWDYRLEKRLHILQSAFIDESDKQRIVDASKDTIIQEWETKEQERQMGFVHNLMKCCWDYLSFVFNKTDSLFSQFKRIDNDIFELPLSAVKDDAASLDMMTDFIQKYRYTCEPVYTIDFDWGLSSGEENMLRIFSNLYYVFDRDYSSGRYGDYKIYNNDKHIRILGGGKECDTVILFMDEADLTLHPEWQRRLIASLTSCIPQIYPSSCVKSIQLILTTHSPLILGDIPSENITYLYLDESDPEYGQDIDAEDIKVHEEKKEKHQLVPGETFGQNIHTILKENFFLNKGTVGAFAASKINMVAQRLDELKEPIANNENLVARINEMKELRKTLNLVAPGVLRNKLEELYKEAHLAIEEIEAEQKRNILEEKLNPDQLLQLIRDYSAEERRYIYNYLQQAMSDNEIEK